MYVHLDFRSSIDSLNLCETRQWDVVDIVIEREGWFVFREMSTLNQVVVKLPNAEARSSVRLEIQNAESMNNT